nr:DUF4340 domain-containing protein [Desulfobulbaceae bacterium]
MNKKNSITILVVLLLIQAALIVYLYRPGQKQSAPSVSLLSTVESQAVSSLAITDENDSTIIMKKKGEAWFVGEEQFPADSASVESIIQKISGLESARLVSRTKSSHNRLKVGDAVFNRKVVLGSDKGDSIFFMGTAPSSKSVHLRVSGHNEVYQVAGISAWELQAERDSWWQTKYVTLEPEAINALTITNTHGTISLKRSDDEKWQFGGELSGELDQQKAAALIGSISNISISEYLKKDFSIDTKPACRIEYRTDKGTISLQIWPKSEDNDDHVAKLSTAEFYSKLRSYIIQEALDATSQELLVEEPEQGVLPAPALEQ